VLRRQNPESLAGFQTPELRALHSTAAWDPPDIGVGYEIEGLRMGDVSSELDLAIQHSEATCTLAKAFEITPIPDESQMHEVARGGEAGNGFDQKSHPAGVFHHPEIHELDGPAVRCSPAWRAVGEAMHTGSIAPTCRVNSRFDTPLPREVRR
jgi:hypothetical protein